MIQLIPAGGLGNQLFQVAASYSLAIDNDEEFSICGSNHLLPLQGFPISSYKDNFFRYFSFSDVDPSLDLYQYEGSEFRAIKPSKNICLFGYFQSEKYFYKNRKKITEAFSPTESIEEYIEKNYSINKDSIALHVRRGDYLKLSHIHPPQSLEYYTKALEEIGSGGEVLVFSDDLPWCMDNFSHERFRFIDEEDFLCIYIMSMCPYLIGCNSSFSWWGAYLNKEIKKKVTFPSSWLGDRLFSSYSDIYLKEWSLI